MAKKVKRGKRKGFFAKAKRYYGRNKDTLNLGAVATGSLIYGAIRARASNALTPLTAKIPAGNIADEIALAVAAFGTHKFVKNKDVRNVAKAALTVEMARIGDALASGQVNLGGNTAAASSSGKVF